MEATRGLEIQAIIAKFHENMGIIIVINSKGISLNHNYHISYNSFHEDTCTSSHLVGTVEVPKQLTDPSRLGCDVTIVCGLITLVGNKC